MESTGNEVKPYFTLGGTRDRSMNATTRFISHWQLRVTVTAIMVLAMMGMSRSHAEENGFFGGRSLIGGAPVVLLDNKAQLAEEPGSVALGGDTARLDGGRIFGGYRFGSAFALEGAQTRFGTPATGIPNETLSVAGVSSLPLSDSVTLNAKLGLHRPDAGTPTTGGSLSDPPGTGVLYGLGLSMQLAQNVELRAQSERFARPSGSSPGTSADTFLFGANVRF
jgi:hypothetical protein